MLIYLAEHRSARVYKVLLNDDRHLFINPCRFSTGNKERRVFVLYLTGIIPVGYNYDEGPKTSYPEVP